MINKDIKEIKDKLDILTRLVVDNKSRLIGLESRITKSSRANNQPHTSD